MAGTTAAVAEGETRQSMIRVWMAISAVWVAFWLSIALIVFANVEFRYPLTDELAPFSLIVLTPPIALLVLGAVGRWAFELFARLAGQPGPSR